MSSQDWIINNCVDKSVLHLGCGGDLTIEIGPEACLHNKLSKVGKRLDGVEVDIKALNYVKGIVRETEDRKYYHASVETMNNVIRGDYDVVVAGSIIEHLANPGLMLGNIVKVMGCKSYLLIVTPHIWGVLQFLRVAFKKNEAVNPEHTMWFSIPTLNELCFRYGLVPVEYVTGYGSRWSVDNKSIKKILGVSFFKLFPHLGGTLMVKYKRST